MAAPRCVAQTAQPNQNQTTSSSPGSQADQPGAPEPKTSEASERFEARFLTPPPAPGTFRPQRGQRAWEREGQQRLVEARGRLWTQARNTRDGYAETRRRLRPEPAAETKGGTANP